MTASNVRVGRASRFLVARQAAKGTAASDFTTAGSAVLRTPSEELPVHRAWQPRDDWMTSTTVDETAGRIRLPEEPAGEVTAYATLESLRFLLRSLYGSSTYAWQTQIPTTEWLTLGWVDGVNCVRVRDAWFTKVVISAPGPVGPVLARGAYVGRATSVDALAGVTLPAAPYAPTDENAYATQTLAVTRDPAGAAVALQPDEATLTLERVAPVAGWDMLAQSADAYAGGGLETTLELTARVDDETWTALTNSRAGTKQRYRFAVGGLSVDLHEVALEFKPLRRDDQGRIVFRAAGVARRSGSNYVDVTLS